MTGTPFRHVVRAKLRPTPIPEGLIVRPRVIERLSVDDRFTMVSAMPGYGKTAAVRQWVETAKVPVAWLSLDLLDQEPGAFWSNVLLALGSAAAGVDHEPAMLLAERGPSDTLFLGALVAGLSELDTPLVLVLDGVTGQLPRLTLDGLSLLVERAGESLHIAMTTRSDPPLPLARWRALGWLHELREDCLRLTDAEAVEIAATADTTIRAVDDVIGLNRRVDGWPIALHMALLARPAGVPAGSAANLTLGSDRLLANYLVAEVLDAMSEEERNAALALSVLEWFDPDLCTALVGEHAAPVVRRLLGRGMFLSVVDPRVGSMRFHDLFRELMEMELGWRDPPARLDLHRRAAMLWRTRGDLMSAYHHLAVIGETGRAHDLLVGPVLALVDEGDLDGLRRCARQLPAPRQVTNASLALDLAVISLFADGTVTAGRWCDRARELIDERASGEGGHDEGNVDEDEDTAVRLHVMRSAIALLDADLDGALEALHGATSGPPRRAGIFERRVPIVASRAMLALRRRDDADEWITAAQRLEGPEIVSQVTVPTLRAWHEWMFGSLERAIDLIDGALGWMSVHRIGPHHLAFDTLITGGWCRLSSGDIDAATRLSMRAAADAETLGCAWNHLQSAFLASRLALVTGNPAGALQIIDELRETVDVDACRSYADRLVGVEIEALVAAGRSVDAVRAISALVPGSRADLLRARYRAASDREVEELLAGRASWPVMERLQAELVLNARSKGAAPSEALVALVGECGESGWVLPFLGLGTRVERLLRSMPLERLHPRLARTLDYLAPSSPHEDRPGARLTSREMTLLELLPTHLSYAEIGGRLFLSVNTVKSNLKSLYRKLDATTRAEAVETSRQAGLL